METKNLIKKIKIKNSPRLGFTIPFKVKSTNSISSNFYYCVCINRQYIDAYKSDY